MSEQFSKFNELPENEFDKVNPSSAEVPNPIDLTAEEDQSLIDVLQRAREAEKAGDHQSAAALYGQYKDEYKRIKQEKLGGELGEKIGLLEQYQSQLQILETAGVLQELSDGTKGIVGIDNKEYSIPTFEEIQSRITPEKAAILEKKQEQGFSKLLVVPFGMKLDDLIGKYRELLLKKDSEGKLLATDGSKLDLDRNQAVWMWSEYNQADINGKLVYDPQSFDENHQGKTKQELINRGSPWRVELIEDCPDLPAEGGGKTVGDRPQLEANQSSNDYLNTIKTNPDYTGEKGLDPESWLTYAITSLEEGKGQIDDYQGQGKISFLTGAYFTGSVNVPLAYWSRVGRRAYLGGSAPSGSASDLGCRSSVEIQ